MDLTYQPPKKQTGVAIIEAMIAILIFSVGVLGIVGMQANMVKNTADSKYRADASYFAQQTVGTLWADMEPIANLDNHLGLSTIADLPGGQLNVEKTSVITNDSGVTVGGVFTIRVGWTAPGETAATDDTLPPCYMKVAHCYSTVSTITEGM
ncbi:MAG: hypothetical protein PHF20_05785 [Halothiobacillaceae bacterium]|nr:hypothetical protein [Halothiobacillaceae bacterium]